MKHYRILRKQLGAHYAPWFICQEERKFLWWKYWVTIKGSKWTFNQEGAEQHMQELLKKSEHLYESIVVKEYWK
ncbi:hypothetical protein D3C85_681690 [compost metagenome]